MAPKKDAGKGAAPAGKGVQAGPSKAGFFTEVERTFLELQVADCNKKIVRLKGTVDKYEQRNEELQKAYEKLDEDRADIIAYLKKVLSTKNEDNTELKDKVKGLEEARELEATQFKEKINEIEKNFTTMKDQLTSENKLLAGKLNTLEEFRATRDDLMKKFEKQEKAFKDQELKYKRLIYDAEKKLVIGKDRLKKDMEARVLQLAQDFQDATELRIAASTHRVIRENIAVNNELDNLLSLQGKLAEQSEKYKENERASRIAMEVAEEERDKAINKNIVQLKVIDRLSTAYQQLKKEHALTEKANYDIKTLQEKVKTLTKQNEELTLQVRILEQNLYARVSEQNKATIESSKIVKDVEQLKKILRETAFAIQAAIKLDQWSANDPAREVMDRKKILSQLLETVTQYKDLKRAESLETITAMGKVYEKGDLGFVPKPVPKKSAISLVPKDKEKEPVRVKDRRSTAATSISTSSLGSVKTVPSMKLVQPTSALPEVKTKVSLLSFQTSTKSSESSTVEEEEVELTDIERQLEASKLEIQKSILKDLAYSQQQLASESRIAQKMSEIIEDEHDEIDSDLENAEQAPREHVEKAKGSQVELEVDVDEEKDKDEEKLKEGDDEGADDN